MIFGYNFHKRRNKMKDIRTLMEGFKRGLKESDEDRLVKFMGGNLSASEDEIEDLFAYVSSHGIKSGLNSYFEKYPKFKVSK